MKSYTQIKLLTYAITILNNSCDMCKIAYIGYFVRVAKSSSLD